MDSGIGFVIYQLEPQSHIYVGYLLVRKLEHSVTKIIKGKDIHEYCYLSTEPK